MALAPERDAESSYGLLRVYSYYRATLSLLLILMYFLLRRSESAPVLQHELYLYTAIPWWTSSARCSSPTRAGASMAASRCCSW
jgi:hypothetical protein